jgi:hypothetical protein
VSTSSTSTRESSFVFGSAALSYSVSVPSGCRRASCCHANDVPDPIAKSLRLPPSRQTIRPVSLSIL